jgi:hypothetical protein
MKRRVRTSPKAELDATVLQQVRDAPRRIEERTFGRWVVDGGRIDTKRLDPVPWTPYCAESRVIGREEGYRDAGLLLPKLMNKRDGDRSFTDRGRHPLNVGTANSHGDPPRGRT